MGAFAQRAGRQARTIARIREDSYVSHNNLSTTDLPGVIETVYKTLFQIGAPAEPEVAQKPAVPIRKSITNPAIICLECGKQQKTLKRHLGTAHNMTPDEYRAKRRLGRDYLMVASDYSEKAGHWPRRSGWVGKLERRRGRRKERPEGRRQHREERLSARKLAEDQTRHGAGAMVCWRLAHRQVSERLHHPDTPDLLPCPRQSSGFAVLLAEHLVQRLDAVPEIVPSVSWAASGMISTVDRQGLTAPVRTASRSPHVDFPSFPNADGGYRRMLTHNRGRCMGNVFIERLWRSLKYEAVYLLD